MAKPEFILEAAIDVWCEGYRATGQSSGAIRLGVAPGSTLKEACDALATCDDSFRKNYDPKTMTFWGCGLFDNEADARRRFG